MAPLSGASIPPKHRFSAFVFIIMVKGYRTACFLGVDGVDPGPLGWNPVSTYWDVTKKCELYHSEPYVLAVPMTSCNLQPSVTLYPMGLILFCQASVNQETIMTPQCWPSLGNCVISDLTGVSSTDLYILRQLRTRK